MLVNASMREEPVARGVRPALMVVAALLLLPGPAAAASGGEAALPDPAAPVLPVEDALAPAAGEEPSLPGPGAPAADPLAPVIGAGAVAGPPPLPLAGPVPSVSALAAGCPGAGSRPRRGRARTMRAALLCLVNHARARNGVRALHADGRLSRAAGRHARDMVRRRYFGHQRIGGRSPSGRARAAGWRGSALGEAIAYGCGRMGSAASTVRAWLNSPGHRAILLSRSYGRVGIGLATRAPVSCRGGATWVLDAGRG